jgi:hypothetical protein
MASRGHSRAPQRGILFQTDDGADDGADDGQISRQVLSKARKGMALLGLNPLELFGLSSRAM